LIKTSILEFAETAGKLHGELAGLFRQISAEQDTQKFLDLVERLNTLLEEKNKHSA
jgi:hypothetical protein